MVHNPNRRFSGHARALAEIRSSLKPFEATESGYSSCNEGQSCTQPESINKQVLDQLRAAGVEEVCFDLCFMSHFPHFESFLLYINNAVSANAVQVGIVL